MEVACVATDAQHGDIPTRRLEWRFPGYTASSVKLSMYKFLASSVPITGPELAEQFDVS